MLVSFRSFSLGFVILESTLCQAFGCGANDRERCLQFMGNAIKQSAV